MQKQHLAAVYQLIATIEKPARFKKLLKRSFGDTEVALAVKEHSHRALKQSLANAGIREERDSAYVFERIYSLLDRISASTGLKINKTERNKVIAEINPAEYSEILAIPHYLNRDYTPHELGSFEASEVISGVVNYIICNQTMLNPSPRIEPVLNNLISRGKEVWNGYAYDICVHDVVALAMRPNQRATIYVKEDYVSSIIDFEGSGNTAWIQKHCADNKLNLVFHV